MTPSDGVGELTNRLHNHIFIRRYGKQNSFDTSSSDSFPSLLLTPCLTSTSNYSTMEVKRFDSSWTLDVAYGRVVPMELNLITSVHSESNYESITIGLCCDMWKLLIINSHLLTTSNLYSHYYYQKQTLNINDVYEDDENTNPTGNIRKPFHAHSPDIAAREPVFDQIIKEISFRFASNFYDSIYSFPFCSQMNDLRKSEAIFKRLWSRDCVTYPT
ncbi:CLUMA_CG020430, isoform A [Clunio marinus]|uniref:CLUMA_CG020430, isoform A n=1 Tax=Clunio marinus TaxID=568069 RepID=A0A1J1J4X4_9DIPT|nr:CLUMA_CG020430, isoform A [Clunio marinus]